MAGSMAVNKIPEKPHSAAMDELYKGWNAFADECQQSVGPDWSELSRETKSVDDVISGITPKTSKHEKAKSIFHDSLDCLLNIGSIISQSTGGVFPASGQCFNALTFVIGAVQGYMKVFTDFADLVEGMTGFLARVAVYLRDECGDSPLETEDVKQILGIFHLFLEALAKVQRLKTSYWKKTRVFLGIMFLKKDPGIANAKLQLEQKVSSFTRLEITMIRGAVQYNITKVNRVMEDVKSIKSTVEHFYEDTRLGWRKQKVKDLLRIGDIMYHTQEIHNNLPRRAVIGTGEWLREHESFSRWSGNEPPADDIDLIGFPQVFLIKAPSGFGKTFLCNSISRRLEERYPEEKVSVGYFYFDNKSHLDAASINRALRCLVWQFVERSQAYLNNFEEVSRSAAILYDTRYLWQRLVLDAAKDLNMTLFIVLDGIDGLMDNAESLLAEIIALTGETDDAFPRIRVCIAGSSRGLDTLYTAIEQATDKRPKWRPFSIVQLRLDYGRPETFRTDDQANGREWTETKSVRTKPRWNSDDINSFLEKNLNDLFHNGAGSVPSKTQQNIQERLAANSNGSFTDLHEIIDQLSRYCEVDNVDSALADFGQVQKDEPPADIIANLGDNLTISEIKELNAILAWVLADGPEEASLDLIMEAMAIRAGGGLLGSVSHRIQNRYSAVLALEAGSSTYIVAVRSEKMRDYLRPRVHSSPMSPRELLASLTFGNTTYNADGFSRVGATASVGANTSTGTNVAMDTNTNVKSKIHFDAAASSLETLELCLKAISDCPDDNQYLTLRQYAHQYLDHHLSAVRPDSIDEDATQRIVTRLLKFYDDTSCISAWWEDHCSTPSYKWNSMSQAWANLDAAMIWLRAPSATTALKAHSCDKGSVCKVLEQKAPTATIMESTTMWIANQWLTVDDDADHADQCFLWLLVYFSKVEPSWASLSPAARAKQMQFYLDQSPPPFASTQVANQPPARLDCLPEFVKFIDHCIQRLLGSSYSVAQLNYRLAEVLTHHGCHPEAISRCQKALSLEPDHWRCQLCLADAWMMESNFSSAVQALRSLRDQSQHYTGQDTESEASVTQQLLTRLMVCHAEMGDLEHAAVEAQQLLDYCVEQDLEELGGNIGGQLVVMLSSMEQWKKAVEVMKRLDKLTSPPVVQGALSGTWLITLLCDSADAPELHQAVRAAALPTNTYEWLVPKYNQAMHAFRWTWTFRNQDIGIRDPIAMQKLAEKEGWLRYYLAELHFCSAQKAAATSLWEDLAKDMNSFDELTDVRTYFRSTSLEIMLASRKKLAKAYTLVAKDAAAHRQEKSFQADIDKLIGIGHGSVAARLVSMRGESNHARAFCGQTVREALTILISNPDGLRQPGGALIPSELYRVAAALQSIGDDANALWAWQYLFALITMDNSPTHVTLEYLAKTTSFPGGCSGPCGKGFFEENVFYICPECVGVYFNTECYKELQPSTSALQWDACSKEHGHLRISAPSEEVVLRASEHKIAVASGAFVPFREWLDSIADDWSMDFTSIREERDAEELEIERYQELFPY